MVNLGAALGAALSAALRVARGTITIAIARDDAVAHEQITRLPTLCARIVPLVLVLVLVLVLLLLLLPLLFRFLLFELPEKLLLLLQLLPSAFVLAKYVLAL